MLILARESSSRFVGYQVSHWSCYHIDDLDDMSATYLTASLHKLKDKPLGRLVDELANFSKFMQTVVHQTCSMIRDTKIERTIQRIELVMRLCKQDHQFLSIFKTRLIQLQASKG